MPALIGFKHPPLIITPPTYVGTGSSSGGSSSPITPTLPTGWQQNDILIISLSIDGSADPSAPTGYTRLSVGGSHYSSLDSRSIIFGKRATSSESNPSITFPGGGALHFWVAKMYAFRGCLTSDPAYNVSFSGDDFVGATRQFSPLNITVDKTFVFGMMVFNGTTTGYTVTNNAGLTSTVTDSFSTSSNIDGGATVFGGVLASAGVLGQVKFTGSSVSSFGGQVVLALAPKT